MKKTSLYFLFYRKTFLLPLAAASYVYVQNRYTALSILLSAIVLAMLYVFRRFLDDPQNKKLYFYFNHGFSLTKLYGFVFLLNLLLLTILFFVL